jgi:hypothetical protein
VIKLVREHRLLTGVGAAALLSAVILIWISLSQGNPVDDEAEAPATTVASGQTTSPTQPPKGEVIAAWPADASQSEEESVRDGVSTVVARLSFDERVDSLATVNAGGHQWVLSEFPTDTRTRLVNEGLAGPALDPLGGEVLLVEDGVIVRAFSMNEFPPSFLETDGALVYAGRVGDGGYPDSALMAINPRTLLVNRIVLRSDTNDLPTFYDDHWEEGEPAQRRAFREDDYLHTLRAMSGTLTDGDSWIVRDDPNQGLCVTIGDINYGCDDTADFVGQFDPAHTPRFVALRVPPEGIDYEQIGILAFGYLPEGAEGVEFRDSESRRMEFATFTNADLGIWVAPVVVGREDFSARYLDGGGDVLLEWPDG